MMIIISRLDYDDNDNNEMHLYNSHPEVEFPEIISGRNCVIR